MRTSRFLQPTGRSADDEALVKRFADSLLHHGPDDEGTCGDADAGVALGHRRLSVIDLSPRRCISELSFQHRCAWIS